MRYAAPALLLVLVLAAGCGSNKDKSSSDDATAPAFEGVPWVLSSGIEVAGAEQAAPSAEFSNGTVGGSTGCNHYTADYTFDLDSLTIGTIASTRAACPPPGHLVETAYLTALGKVEGWRSEVDSKLVLVDSDGDALLTYTVATPVGDWEATAVQTGEALVSPQAGAPITAKFGEDGKLSGSGGCNSYSTTYTTTEQGGITIKLPGSTRMLCTKHGVSELESAYFAALPTATHFRVDGGTLSLLRADGTFVAAYTKR